MNRRLIFVMSIVLCLSIFLCGCVKHAAIPYEVYEGTIHTQQGVFIDTETNILRFSEDAVLEYGSTQLPIGGMEFELSGVQDGDKLYYHPDSQRIYPFDSHQSICLGTYRQPVFLSELNMDSSVLYVDQRDAATLAGLKEITVACLGDSMTCGPDKYPGYIEFLPQLLGVSKVIDYGLSRSCIALDPDTSPNTEYCIRYAEMDENADMIFVLGCVNDWYYNRELGQPSDTSPVSFYGAMRTLCVGLKEKYPNAQIYMFSSPESNPENFHAMDMDGSPWEGNTEGFNRIGKQLADYAQAMQTVCQEEDIFFYSLTEELPWELFDGEDEPTVTQKCAMIAELISEYILNNYNP